MTHLGASFGTRNYPDMVVFHIKREPVDEPEDIDICYHHPEDSYPDVSIQDIMNDPLQEKPQVEPRFACQRCGCSYVRRYHLLRHQKHECGVPPYLRRIECDVCGYRTARKSSVLRHIQRVHCGTSAGAYPRVVVQRKLGPPAAFPCGGCAKSYPLAAMLDKHRRLECGREDFLDAWLKDVPPSPPPPPAVGDAPETKHRPKSSDPTIDPDVALKIYKDTVAASVGAERWQCPKCERFFTRKDSLRRHLMKACSPKAYVPPPTSVGVGQRSRSSESTTTPSAPRLPCPRCAKTFASKHGLKAHRELTCQRPATLACQHCPYLGRLKHHLVSHIANNHPVDGGLPPKPTPPAPWRPYACPVCGKSYKYKTDLGRHVRLSCGQNPVFACPRCPRRYRHQFGLDRHVSLECGVEPAHPCAHCPYRAKRPFSLVSHVRNRHPEFAQ